MARGIDLTWAGGEHCFDISKIELLRALQEKCDAGPPFILARIGSNQWHVDDIVSTIRLALEGGGLEKETARKLTKLHVEDRPLMLSVLTAQAALAHALYGAEDDPVGGDSSGEAQAPAE